MSRELFQRIFMNRLRTQYPRVHVLQEKDLDVELFVGGERILLPLEAIHRECLAAPDTRDRVIDAHLNGIMQSRMLRSGSFEALRRQILPMLKHPDFIEESRRLVPEKALLFTPFVVGLQIAYVVDEPRTLRYINTADLVNWNTTAEEIGRIARANLIERTPVSNLIRVGEGASRLFIYNTMDQYDATRILLHDHLRELSREVTGKLVVGIPNRDFLIAFGDSDRQLLERVRWQVKRDNHAVEYRLTDRLLVVAGERLEEYR